MPALGLVAAMLAMTLEAAADSGTSTIYRCGLDGRSFSDRPCGESAAAITPKVDRPDPQRADEARAVAQREAQLADRLRSERLQRENAPKSGASGFHPHEASGDENKTRPPKRPKPRSHRIKRDRGVPIADGMALDPAAPAAPPATPKAR
jgi:hypothetical protein